MKFGNFFLLYSLHWACNKRALLYIFSPIYKTQKTASTPIGIEAAHKITLNYIYIKSDVAYSTITYLTAWPEG